MSNDSCPSDIPNSIGCINVFTLPKLGMSTEQNEDATAVRFDQSALNLRIAIADGATDSVFSGRWADLLVKRFVDQPQRNGINEKKWLRIPRREFVRSIDFSSLPWYSLTKLEKGAHATLLGFRLDVKTRKCRVWSVGDCSLISVNHSGISRIFPSSMCQIGAFTSSPQLLVSREDSAIPKQQFQSASLENDSVDLLFMTDAIGKYAISNQSPDLLRELIELHNAEQFANFVRLRQREGLIRNDDCTLLHLHLA